MKPIILEFEYDNGIIKFPYHIIRKNSTKNIYIRIKNDTAVITSSTRTSLNYLHNFVATKAIWINKHLNTLKPSLDLSKTGSTIYLLGSEYPVAIKIDSTTKKESIEWNTNVFTCHLNCSPTHEQISALRDKYYKDKTQEHIMPLVDKWVNIMKLHPNKVTFRKTKSRWGSCSSKDSISLNTRLMMLPIHLIEYIIIHELSHIKHKNHSSKFWSTVEIHEANWREKRKELRKFESAF